MDKNLLTGPILAPMVRASFTGMRQIALSLGASCVFTDVVTAQNILQSNLYESDNYWLFVRNGCRILQLSKQIIGRTVVQLAGTQPDVVRRAALRLKTLGVGGVDLNVGCNREWASQANMGAELLDNQTLLLQIVRAMVTTEQQVSVKIRLLGTLQQSVQLVRDLFETGANAVTIHMRRQSEERKETTARWAEFLEVHKECSRLGTLIANGDIFGIEEYKKFKTLVGEQQCPPVMVARGALRNPGCFTQIREAMEGRPIAPVVTQDILLRFVQFAEKDNEVFEQKELGEGQADLQLPLDFMDNYKFQEAKTAILMILKEQRKRALDLSPKQLQVKIANIANAKTVAEVRNGIMSEPK